VLGYLRQITFERATTDALDEAARTELLERMRKAGVDSAEKVLVTDLVVQ
jgi:hypothetical protein